jgi:uncharacterized membrane protein
MHRLSGKNAKGSLARAALCLAVCIFGLGLYAFATARPKTNHQPADGAAKQINGEYRFFSFDPPGSVGTFPFGINDQGLIAGQYTDADGVTHGFALEDGKYTVIDVPGAPCTLSSGPDMEGRIALGYCDSSDNIHPAVYFKGQFTYLPDAPGQSSTSPSAINARGEIAGTTWNGDFTIVHSYLWDGKSYEIFDDPATDIPFTLALGMNNQGQVVGQYNTSNGVIHGFLMYRGKYAEIAFPGAPNTAAIGINDSDVIVGLHGPAGAGPFGFAVGGEGFVLWKGTYWNLDYPNAQTSFSIGINDRGQIVGVYQDGAGNFHGYLATPK